MVKKKMILYNFVMPINMKRDLERIRRETLESVSSQIRRYISEGLEKYNEKKNNP